MGCGNHLSAEHCRNLVERKHANHRLARGCVIGLRQAQEVAHKAFHLLGREGLPIGYCGALGHGEGDVLKNAAGYRLAALDYRVDYLEQQVLHIHILHAGRDGRDRPVVAAEA